MADCIVAVLSLQIVAPEKPRRKKFRAAKQQELPFFRDKI
jgi:hypothetical protein